MPGNISKMETCVTPGWNRPEFFKIWTELVCKCQDVEDMLFIFCLDYGYDRKYDEIIEEFPYDCAVIRMPLSRYKLGKQSHNVLNGMFAGVNNSDGLVFYVEEDIFPGKDFFRWHRAVHAQQKDIFCSIGTRNVNTPFKTNGDRNAYYLSNKPDYQSWGSCFKREKIIELIKPHFNESYLKDPDKYCLRTFPNSFLKGRWTEQDGLIRRILELNKGLVAFPHLPRGYHSGFYGYNRQPGILGQEYEKRLELVREIVFNKDKMKEWCMNEQFYQDSIPVDLDTDFDELRHVPC